MADTDLGAKVGLRWPKGPFEKMNSIGIDKAYNMVEKRLKAWPSIRMPEILVRQKEKGEPWDIRYERYTKDGDVGRVTISRPDVINALNDTVVIQLDEEFTQAEKDPETRVISAKDALDIGLVIIYSRRRRLTKRLYPSQKKEN